MEGLKLKKYEVIIQDEWNNLYQIGFYDKLEDAIPEINDFLSVYEVEITELVEYPSTFGTCFDTEIETKDENVIMIRGFVLDVGNQNE